MATKKKVSRSRSKVLFINNDGAGFAGEVPLKAKTTVEAFFKDKMKSANPDGFLIRVNRQVATATQVLKNGDRVTFTPTKVHGA